MRLSAQKSPEIADRVDVFVNIGNVKVGYVQLGVRGGTLCRLDVVAYRPAAERVEVLVAGHVAVNAAHHESDEQLGCVRMLALAYYIQGVDCRDTGGRLEVYRSQAPAVVLVLAELGGCAEAYRRVGLTLGADGLSDFVRRRSEDRLVVVQTLQELIACVLAALRSPTQKPVIQEPHARLSSGFCIRTRPFQSGSVSCQMLVIGEPSGFASAL